MSTHMHLAELIEDELKERGWTLDELVNAGGPYASSREWSISRLSWDFYFAAAEMNDPVISLGSRGAEELGRAFDIDPQFFLDFHEAWRKAQVSA